MRMAGRRDEDRALQVFVQIGAADAAPGHIDADRSGCDLGYRDVLDPDVAAGELARRLQVSLQGCEWGSVNWVR